ncbi:MAG: hypothetical protein NVS3B12_33290 [Acidimicrobiales bacterium]
MAPERRFGLRIILLAVAVLLVAGPFGFLLAQVTGNGRLVHADASVASDLHGWALSGTGRVSILRTVTFFGSGLWLFALVGVAAAVLAIRRRPRLAAYVVVTAAMGGIIDSIVKAWVARPRPVFAHPILLEPGKSFPSGHAMSSTVVYGSMLLVLIPLVPRRARAVPVLAAAALVSAICFTRLALGVHYVTDVLGGVVLGLAWLAASTSAFTAWRRERTGHAVAVTEGLEPDVAEVGDPERD